MIEEALANIDLGRSARHALGSGGVLHLDRSLPFLIVHRRPGDRPDDGTARLVTGEASYLIAEHGDEEEAGTLVRRLAEAGSTHFGAFLVLEIWSAPDPESRTFTVRAPEHGPAPETIGRLVASLRPLRRLRPGLEVVVDRGADRHPPGRDALLTLEQSWQSEVLVLGLEVPPVYRDDGGNVYPRFLRRLQRGLSRAFRKTAYEFIRVQTSAEVENHLALGTRSLPDRVWQIDRELVALERSFDILLLTSPVNFQAARARFEESGWQRSPEFHYRLLPIDPDLVKRRLFDIEMEAIDDPALADLFQDKRAELDTMLTMLGERAAPTFRHSSHRLYGTVDTELLKLANRLLAEVPRPGPAGSAAHVDAQGFRDAAERELELYRQQYPGLDRHIQIRRDVAGLMVSEGNLLIGATLRLRPERVEPLLHHEVGTHVLTYVNGSAQPLEQLSLGLADYDELQEGLAVLAEYLVGGLDAVRMRLLAARVVAAHSVENGADFVETFRLLTEEYGYTRDGAWHIAARVHASGGFTRDLIYLRGLVRLIELLRAGGELEPLYVGKIAQRHIPIVDELRHRGVLDEPPLSPRLLADNDALDRLAAVRRGIPLTEMICSPNP